MTWVTVHWHTASVDELARLWPNTESRKSIEAAANEIDQLLRVNPASKGKHVYAGMLDATSLEALKDRMGANPEVLRWLRFGPLEVFFTADELDRQAIVWRVRASTPNRDA